MEVASILFFILVVIYFAFAVTLGLISKKLERRGLGYLYVFFLLQALILLAPALIYFKIDISYSAYITGPIKVTLTPLLYIFIKKLAQKEKKLTVKEYWHFLPFVLDLILTLIVAPGHADKIVSQSNLKVSEILKVSIEGNIYYNILALSARIIAMAQGFYYSYLIYKLFKKIGYVMHHRSSVISDNDLFWIRLAAILIGIKGLVAGGALFGIYSIPIVFLCMFIFMIFFGFYFFNHAVVQPDISYIEDAILDIDRVVVDPQYDLGVLESFKDRQLYLKPDLTLQEAADELLIVKYKLSGTIKYAGYTNFYSFVNEQRVEFSKEILKDLPGNFSMDSVVNESGFQSRSTFYRVFKNITGVTPKEYIDNKKNKP